MEPAVCKYDGDAKYHNDKHGEGILCREMISISQVELRVKKCEK